MNIENFKEAIRIGQTIGTYFDMRPIEGHESCGVMAQFHPYHNEEASGHQL